MLGKMLFQECNLAPAKLPKQASLFDLPISLVMFAGSGQRQPYRFDKYAVVGELGLEGNARPVKGALSVAIATARQSEQVIVLPFTARKAGETAADPAKPPILAAFFVGFGSTLPCLDSVPCGQHGLG